MNSHNETTPRVKGSCRPLVKRGFSCAHRLMPAARQDIASEDVGSNPTGRISVFCADILNAQLPRESHALRTPGFLSLQTIRGTGLQGIRAEIFPFVFSLGQVHRL